MEPILNSKPFELFVTHVKKEHGLVKIFGQIDISTGQVVEKYLRAVHEQLEGGNAPQLTSLEVGQVIVASRDKSWYRAKVVSVDSTTSRVVVYMLDHGQTVPLPLASIRTGVHSQLSQVQPLAVPFMLGEVVPPGGDWSKPAIEFVTDAVVDSLCRSVVTHRARGNTFVRLYARGQRESLAQDMVQCGMAVSGLPNIDSIPPAQNYVQPQQSIFPPTRAPPSPNYPPPLSVIVPPMPPPHLAPPPQFLSAPPVPRTTLFRPMHLETGKWYPVYLSSTEGGPADFCVQLESLSKRLEEVMEAVNSTSLRPLPPPAIQAGVPCLARYTLDNTIYRAVVLKRDSLAKVYYLDYGNSEVLPLESVYAIPPGQLATQMLSVRCSVYQWPELGQGDRQRAKDRLDTMNDRVLQCRVVSAEGGSFASARTVVQLYEDGQDIGQEIRLWLARQNQGVGDNLADWGLTSQGKMAYSSMNMTGVCEVYLSHPGTGPEQFYVTRADSSSSLSGLMREVRELAQGGSLFPLNNPQQGTPCLARYSDGVWYRATVQTVSGGQVSVYYVDYGNTSTVATTGVSAIPPALVSQIPAQAVQCKLGGVSQQGEMGEKFRSMVRDDKFRIRVERLDGGVCVVQASTLPPPGININTELGRMSDNRNTRQGWEKMSSSPSTGVAGDTEELFITWVESSNSFYGQLTRLGGQELKEFLARLSDFCHRSATTLYSGSDQHMGDLCAVPDTSCGLNSRFYRAIITRENRDNVEVNLLDVGGRDRVSKNVVYSLPAEFARRQEWGVVCSIGCNPAISDAKLRGLMLNSLIEVKMIRRVGDGVVVAITNNSIKKYKNAGILSHLEQMGGGQQLADNTRLNMLFEKQNNKQNSKMGEVVTNNSNGNIGRNFERGDLRNSLREKRAARELQSAGKGLKVEKVRPLVTSLGVPSYKVGWRGVGRITWMYSPAHFYIQVQGDREVRQFEGMMGRLQGAMREGKEDLTKHWNKGQVVAAKWTDDCWYRGQVINTKGGKMEIFFVDFGNTEKVGQGNVTGLPAEFGQMECQALRVGLAGVEGDWDSIGDNLAKYFNMETYKVEVICGKDKDGVFLVQLNGGDIVKAMVKDKVATSKEVATGNIEGKKGKKGRKEKDASSDSDARSENSQGKGGKSEKMPRSDSMQEKMGKTERQRKAGKLYTAGDFPAIPSTSLVGTTVTGLVSYCISWKEFWLQPQPGVAVEMRENINKADNSAVLGKVVKSIEVGECCLAYWDSVWHRATVTEKKEGGQVIVQFVDFGISQTLPLGEVRDGDFSLYETAPAAIKCKLDSKVDNFEKVLEGQEFKVTVRVRSFKDNSFTVKLEKEKKGKNKGKKERSESGGEIGEGNRVDVTVVHVERVDRVWVVLKEKLPELERMMVELATWLEEEKNRETVQNVEIGMLCCVEFSEDGEMYRCKVVGVEDNVAEVEYIDYGNSEEVDASDILELPQQFKDIEPAGVAVQLRGAGLAMDSEKGKKKLETALGGDKVSLLVENGEGVFWSEGKKVDLSKTLWSKEESVNMFQLAGSPRVECIVSYAEAEVVWLVSKELQQGLDMLMEKLQEKAKGQSKAGRVGAGDLVIAKFSQDKSFYRARVVKVMGHRMEVHYIDFGNKEVVEVGGLKILPQEFRLHPGYAMQGIVDSTGDCRMLGPGEVMDLVGQARQVTAELVQPRGGVVRLYSAGERVGCQPLAQVAGLKLPSTRLRLGEVWLGLITTATSQGLAVQNILAAAGVTASLASWEKDEMKAVVGSVFIQDTVAGPRRVLVQEVGRGQMTLCALDSQQIETVPVKTSLYGCLPRQHSTPPAAITCASLTTKTRDRYQVPGRLMMVSVSNNSLKLVETYWKISAKFSNEDPTPCPVDFPLLSSHLAKASTVLSIQLPSVAWSSSLLSTVRDLVLQAGLQVVFQSGSIVSKPDNTDTLQHILSKLDLPSTDTPPQAVASHNSLTILQSFTEDSHEISQQVTSAGEETSVCVHPALPSLKVVTDKACQYSVVAVAGKIAALKCGEMPNIPHADLTMKDSVATGELCLYSDGSTSHRAVVTDISEEFADVWLVDTGVTVVCDPTELFTIPPVFCSQHPAVFSVSIAGDQSLAAGESVTGTVSVQAGGLVLQWGD